MNIRASKIGALSLFILALNLLPAQVFAVSASDVQSVSGATVNDVNGNLTEVSTDAVEGLQAEVNWNELNINANETLHNIFNANNQTLIHRVIGGNLSRINGQITAGGTGETSGKIILINPNGVYFDGAEVNLPSLIVSTVKDVKITASQAKFDNKNDGISHLQISNSEFNTPYGVAFVSAGMIYMDNSQIHSSNGAIQMITADGVNFKFKNDNIARNANGIKASKGNGSAYIYDSDILADKGTVNLVARAKNKGVSQFINYASQAIQSANGTVYLVSENTGELIAGGNLQINANKISVDDMSLDAGKTVRLSLNDQDLALESYDNDLNRLALSYDNDPNNKFHISNPAKRTVVLSVSKNNTLSINGPVEKNGAFTLSAGEFNIAGNAGIATSKKIKITGKSGDINLISNNVRGIRKFEDENADIIKVNTNTLTGRIDPELLGSGKLEITAQKGNINVYNPLNREISKLRAKGKTSEVYNFELIKEPEVINTIKKARAVEPEKFHVKPGGLIKEGNNLNFLTRSFNPLGNDTVGGADLFRFSEFGGSAERINIGNDLNKFAGIPCNAGGSNCSAKFKFYEVLEPILLY